MNIALITPYADPERGAAVIRVNAFAETWGNDNHFVRVFAPLRGSTPSAAHVTRFQGLWNLFSELNKNSWDVIIGVSPPLPLNFFILLYCRLKKIPFVLDGKEDPRVIVKPQLNSLLSKLKHSVYLFLRRQVYRHAQKIFVLTPADLALETARYNLPAEKFVRIPNGSDPQLIYRNKDERNQLRTLLGISPGQLVFIYAGSLGDEDVHSFIQECAPVFREKNIHILFVLTLDAAELKNGSLASFQGTLATHCLTGLSSIFYNIPFASMRTYFSAADAGILPWPDALVTSLPVKVFDYMAAELPVFVKGPSQGALFDFFQQYPLAGFYATSWSEFKNKVRSHATRASELNQRGHNSRSLILNEFNRAHHSQRALAELKKVAFSGNK